MADQQQPSSSSTTNPVWIDRQTLKKKKHEAAPIIRMNDDAVTRYSAEVGKMKNLDNIAWRRLALNDARFEQLKKAIEANRQMLVAMGEVLEPLLHPTQVAPQEAENNEDMQVDPQVQYIVEQNQHFVFENPVIENNVEASNIIVVVQHEEVTVENQLLDYQPHFNHP